MIPRHLQVATVVLLGAVIGMGIYLVHLKRRAEEVRATDKRPVAAPVTGPVTHLNLFVAYDNEGIVRRQDAEVALPQEASARAREVVRALLASYQGKQSPHVLPAAGDVRNVYLVNGNLAVIDLNAPLCDEHRSGVLVETLTVTSLVATVGANVPGVTRVKFVVEGKDRETLAGHADLSSVYDVASVDELIREMQP